MPGICLAAVTPAVGVQPLRHPCQTLLLGATCRCRTTHSKALMIMCFTRCFCSTLVYRTMASATQPKRMVSSVFITLAPPYRATLTKPQHTLQTHQASARDQQQAAVRVEPRGGDGFRPASQRHRKDSSPSELRPSGGTAPAATRGSDPGPADPHIIPAGMHQDSQPGGNQELGSARGNMCFVVWVTCKS